MKRNLIESRFLLLTVIFSFVVVHLLLRMHRAARRLPVPVHDGRNPD
jgi:hypothetical protein